jgi:lipopolysaccharide transport system ATP-binding protein
MSDVLVKVDNVSKRFCRSLKRSLWYGVQDLGSEIGGRRHGGGSGLWQSSADVELRPDEFWAVKDVNFELRRGECLGLIGRNGAGKTTLLRMLNGLIKPDAGRIQISGRVGALIALEAGFNPILTGRENIFISASVLGLQGSSLHRIVDSVIEFSEIGDFIDSPVQSYSSGMRVRLGFAVAIHIHPDVLLIDEVLAVGDLGFRQKAYSAIHEIIRTSCVIFVSHTLPQVGKVCTKGIVMKDGAVACQSNNIAEVLDGYNGLFAASSTLKIAGSLGSVDAIQIVSNGAELAKLDSVEMLQTASSFTYEIDFRSQLIFSMKVSVHEKIKCFAADIIFVDQEMKTIATTSSRVDHDPFNQDSNGKHLIQVGIPKLPLNSGLYYVTIGLIGSLHTSDVLSERLVALEDVIRMKVRAENSLFTATPVLIDSSWSVKPL